MRTGDEYAKYFAEFEARYALYQQLDQRLSENTRYFQELKADVFAREEDETDASAAKALQLEKALRMKREWDERKAIVYEQLTQYRQLHAELVCLKAGVNRFVEAQGRDVHGRFKAGQKGCT